MTYKIAGVSVSRRLFWWWQRKRYGCDESGAGKPPRIWTMQTLVVAVVVMALAVTGLWLLLYWVTT